MFHLRKKSTAGVALVIILAIVVLVVGIVVGFLNMVSTERTSAAAYQSGAEVRRLADNAVAIVQAQVNHATTQGATVAWASQPGMVRTYAENGTLLNAYKLYSAQSLTISDPLAINGDLPPATWSGSLATWTDLNAPVTSDGVKSYPILDPSSILPGSTVTPPQGFSIATDAPLATGANANPAPMPVKWLYILQDGQVVAPGGSGNEATVNGANAENPITGRIAFWTDDDSAKVNLNTAGESTYWDTPRFNTTEDRKFATSQPVNGEFQRYPGHPATTSLSAVFPNATAAELLTNITPRYMPGGTVQGTVDTYLNGQALNGGVVADDPLFASVDEARFQPSHDARSSSGVLTSEAIKRNRFFLTTASRAPEVNLFNLPRVSMWPIAESATGRSAFDEVIAFASTINANETDPTKRYPFYFQRRSALSATDDASISRNRTVFEYLQKLSERKIPGFNQSLDGKFQADTKQIFTEIWDYIRSTNLYDTRLPSGRQFAGPLNSGGYGYVAPLQNSTGGESYRGFGRGLTVSELAFIFICTADSNNDPQVVGSSALLGLAGSNDATKNRTLVGVPLAANTRRVQMMILPEFFSVSHGFGNLRPKYVRLTIKGLAGLTLNGASLFSTDEMTLRLDESNAMFNERAYHIRQSGGPFDLRAPLINRRAPVAWDSTSRPLYPFISQFVNVSLPLPVPPETINTPNLAYTMSFIAQNLQLYLETSVDGVAWNRQTININPGSSTLPVPNLAMSGSSRSSAVQSSAREEWWGFSWSSSWSEAARGRLGEINTGTSGYTGSEYGDEENPAKGSIIRGLQPYSAKIDDDITPMSVHTDVVRSMVVASGDYRMIAATDIVPESAFAPLAGWSSYGGPLDAIKHNLGLGMQTRNNTKSSYRNRVQPITGQSDVDGLADFPISASGDILAQIRRTGDFDNSVGNIQDGAYINKPDEGNLAAPGAAIPYFPTESADKLDTVNFFSPNRMVAGPGMFGSLSTHVKRFQADPADPVNFWRTLLFRKQPNHPNSVSMSSAGLPDTAAPDHLIMDLFWMPTVEPYAISEPFATAGKINMNSQIQPFTYIKRQTGLYAVLKNEKIASVPGTATEFARYKKTNSASVASYRQKIDVVETLKQFDARFTDISGRLFISPTELCDMWLVPEGQSLGTMESFWNGRKLTGDNVRERPYTTIIPRLTTKSNIFTVHFRVQTLKVPRAKPQGSWNETTGTVTGEYRGSTTIERFIDPNAVLPDYASDPLATPILESFYRWRTVGNRQFSP